MSAPNKTRILSTPVIGKSGVTGLNFAMCSDQWGTQYRYWLGDPSEYALRRTWRTPEGRPKTIALGPKHPDYAQVLAHLQAFATPEAVAAFELAYGIKNRAEVMGPDLYAQVKEVLNLCALGDVDETTEVHGWGDLIKAMRATVATIEGTEP